MYRMASVYIVVENGEAYSMAYPTYKKAHSAVKEKFKVYLEERIKEIANLDDIEKMLEDVNVLENPDGKTNLYIEKGINILISKLAISE